MPGLFSQAIIDPNSDDLVKEGQVSVYTYEDNTELATVYSDYGCSIELNQPLVTDTEGVLTFFATGPGQMFYLSRGGTQRLVSAGAVSTGNPEEQTEIPVTNLTSGDFTFENGVGFTGRIYGPYGTITEDTEIGNLPNSGTTFVDSETDVTITLPDLVDVNLSLIFHQVNDGAVIFDPGNGTLLNLYSHTQTAGPGAVVMLTCTGYIGDYPRWSLTGQTAA